MPGCCDSLARPKWMILVAYFLVGMNPPHLDRAKAVRVLYGKPDLLLLVSPFNFSRSAEAVLGPSPCIRPQLSRLLSLNEVGA